MHLGCFSKQHDCFAMQFDWFFDQFNCFAMQFDWFFDQFNCFAMQRRVQDGGSTKNEIISSNWVACRAFVVMFSADCSQQSHSTPIKRNAIMSEKQLKKTYYPTKTFDDDVDALAKLYQDKGWAFSGVDVTGLLKDAVEQRQERAQHDAIESQYFNLHETFGMAQEARHERFAAALNAARGAFRSNKAIMAELGRFKRSIRSSRRQQKPVSAPAPLSSPSP